MEQGFYRYQDDVDVHSLSVFPVQIALPNTTLRSRPGERHEPLVLLNKTFVPHLLKSQPLPEAEITVELGKSHSAKSLLLL